MYSTHIGWWLSYCLESVYSYVWPSYELRIFQIKEQVLLEGRRYSHFGQVLDQNSMSL